MVKRPSGSKLSLAMKCLGSAVLPRVESDPGPPAIEGKRKHAVLETFFQNGRTHSEGTSPDDRKTCELVARAVGEIPAIGERPEVAIFVSAVDGVSRTLRKEEWSNDGRDHLAGADERNLLVSEGSVHGDRDSRLSEAYKSFRSGMFVAIADLVQLHSDTHASVWDWKSSGYVPEAQWNWQLLLPAIGLWLSSGARSDFQCDLGIAYLDERLESNSVPYSARGDFLRSRFEQLRRFEQRLLSATPENVDLYEGKHCFFCPAAARCPAKIGSLGSALAELGMVVDDLSLVRNYIALKDTWISKTAFDAMERNGNVLDLMDGREAVLTTDGKKRKIYTRKANGQTRSNAPEADQQGEAGGGVETSEGVRVGGEDPQS